MGRVIQCGGAIVVCCGLGNSMWCAIVVCCGSGNSMWCVICGVLSMLYVVGRVIQCGVL